MEYMEEQMISVANANGLLISSRWITVLEMTEVLLTKQMKFLFLISKSVASKLYGFENAIYEVDLFKDFYITKQLLSSIKTT
jgi:branched-chain amino acid aminotransferase